MHRKIGVIRTDRSPSTSSSKDSTQTHLEYGIDSSGNWRNIIYCPFNQVWQSLLIISIFLSVVFNVYYIVYKDMSRAHGALGIGEYCVEIFYFIDTFLYILHRNMPIYRKRKTYEPRSFAGLMFDCLSLIPFYEIYCLIVSASHENKTNKFVTLLKILHILRVYRIYIYCENTRKKTARHHLFMVTFSHLMYSIIVAVFVSTIWYYMRCFKCEDPNWTSTIEDYPVDFQSALTWFILCFTHVKNRYAHNAPGVINGISTNERLLELFVVCVGCATHLMAFNGYLTISYVKSLLKQFTYNRRLELINLLIKDWKIQPVIAKQINKYYHIIWAQKKGFLHIIPLFYELPLSLQKEATVDIFFEALRHSDIFKNEDLAFKRALSIKMHTISLLPGDYLYKFDELKTKLCFISTGIVQILSDEDNESPVISFSGGTLLGEISTLMPTKCLANVRCATYCEMHVLFYVDLNRTILSYPPKRQNIYAHLSKRLSFARYMKTFNETKFGETSEGNKNNIRWLKHRWRLVSELHRNPPESYEQIFETEIDVKHCSNYLHLLVLSKDVELKMKAICLTSKFPYIFEPDSGFRKAWDLVYIVNILLQALLYPYVASFERSLSFEKKKWCLILDMISTVDLFIMLVTAIKKKHILITKPVKILVEHFKSIKFFLDILATIPFDYLSDGFRTNQRTVAVLKLMRLIKIYKPFLFISEKQRKITFNTIYLRKLKYLLVFFISFYWITCFCYIAACYTEDCTDKSWITGRSQENSNIFASKSEDHVKAFVITTVYVVSIYMSIGISRRFQMLLYDIAWAHVMVQVGYYLFSFVVSELAAYYVLTVQEKMAHSEYIESTRQFINYIAKMSTCLQESVVKYMKFQWSYNKGRSPESLVSTLPVNIRNKVVSERIKNVLRQSPIFQVDDEHFMDCVAAITTIRILPPGAILVAANSKTTLLHMCVRGYCRMYSFVTGDKQRGVVKDFGSGYLFPLIESIHDIWALVTIETITTVELLTIPMAQFSPLLRAHGDIKDNIVAAVQWHYHKYNSLLLRTGGRLPEMYALERTPLGDYFQYKLVEEEKIRLKRKNMEYIQLFSELGRWSGVRYLLLSRTIYPKSKYFICWEVFRCVIILLHISLTILSHNALYSYKSLKALILIFKMIGMIDIYIRLHLQYYNENGLLVTHTWYTAKNYFRNSLITDLIGIFPAIELKLHMIIMNENVAIAELLIEMLGLFQYYRINGALNYIQREFSWIAGQRMELLKFLLFSCLCMGYISNVMLFMICKLPAEGEDEMTCVSSWLMSTNLSYNDKSPFCLALQAYYVVVTALAGATNGTFICITYKDYITMTTTFFFGYLIRLYIIPKLISIGIVVNETDMTYRENVIAFKKFTSNELISEQVVANTIDFYEHAWKNMRGSSMEELADKLHPQLYRDLTYYVFGDILRAISFFSNAEESFFQILSIHLTQRYFKKDTDIIRTNDINDLVYVVSKGLSEVYIANKKMAVLRKGGIFGNLSLNPCIRQRIYVTCKLNTTCLVVKNDIFIKIIEDYPAIKKRMHTALVFQFEYMESEQMYIDSMEDMLQSEKNLVNSYFEKVIKAMNMAIINESIIFRIWTQLINIHFACIFSIYQLSMIIIYDNVWMTSKRIIRYAADVLYLIKIITSMHTCYVDPESGMLVLDNRRIRIRYCKKYLAFDLLINLPIELIVQVFSSKLAYVGEYLSLNRVGRFGYIYMFTQYNKTNVATRTNINWICFFYCFLMFLQVTTCIWWWIGCRNKQCTQAIDTEDNFNIYVLEMDFIRSQLLAYSYVINIISMSSVKTVQPRTAKEMIVSIAITIIGLYITAFLTSAFASATMTNNYNLNNFEQKVADIHGYLKDRELSPALQKKINNYLIGLWNHQRGEWMPRMIKNAPLSIKQDVMMPLYGKLLETHYLFARTHKDFLRQLVCHLERVVFFPGYFIVEKGDVDGSMYFIHKGELLQIEVLGTNEISRRVLSDGMCFGERSGLFNVPHKLSYRAITTVDLLQLKKSSWQYLLQFFPASKEEIFLQANENGISRPLSIRNMATYY